MPPTKGLREEEKMHTPTPWIVTNRGDFTICAGNSNGRGEHKCLARLLDKNGAEDAAFIIRAVNSFEGLLKAAKHYSVCDMPEEVRFRCEGCVKAEEAIAKAESSPVPGGRG